MAPGRDITGRLEEMLSSLFLEEELKQGPAQHLLILSELRTGKTLLFTLVRFIDSEANGLLK